MKIVQINKFYFKQGGAEHYLLSLSRLLEKKGHKVIPFAMEHKDNIATEYSNYFPSFVDTLKLGIAYRKLKAVGRMFYSWEAKRKLEFLIKKEKPDIAHLHNIYHQLSPSLLPVLKKYQIPVVMTVHDYKLICPNYILYTKGSPCKRCKGGKYCQAFYNRCLKNSYLASALIALEMHLHKLMKIYEKNIDWFIVPSEFVKKMLVEFGMKEEKIVVVPHFIETESIKPQFGKGEGYFLYVGRLKEEKGVDVLIEAMKDLAPVELKIIGSGPEEDSLKSLVQKLSLGNIKFVGSVPSNELAPLYQKAMAIVIPSRVWETFSLVTAEGMAFGKAVIASELGALPELVEDDKTGLLFESENPEDLSQKLNYLIKNPSKAEEMGKAGRKIVENQLNPEIHYQKILEIYEKAQTK